MKKFLVSVLILLLLPGLWFGSCAGEAATESVQPILYTFYRKLRILFPQVTCYAGGMGPAEFQPVSLPAFLGAEEKYPQAVSVRAFQNDCEEGSSPLPLSESRQMQILKAIPSLRVTGKANSLSVTGGTVSYILSDEEGQALFSFELYGDLLVWGDGMYTLEAE